MPAKLKGIDLKRMVAQMDCIEVKSADWKSAMDALICTYVFISSILICIYIYIHICIHMYI